MLFALADEFLSELGDKQIPYRISESLNALNGRILASLFYEPSTRTRLSFESAMLRLGGTTVSSADPRTSSAAKGESLADTVRVVSNYADVLVMRHPRDGAAKLAASYSPVPVINGGDGSHEHPTQTLCDLFTLRRKNKNLKNLNVAISGDLKGSRTIHSFVYALARFGANILLKPAPGMELPSNVDWRLTNEYGKQRRRDDDHLVDALYVAADQQLPFEPEWEVSIKKASKKGIDAVYVTRFQSERWSGPASEYPKVDAKFLRNPRYRRTSVMHPLPRVGELDISFDQDRRAAYFEQAAYGVPIRMALIKALLSNEHSALVKHPGGFVPNNTPLYESKSEFEVKCVNANCIVHDEIDGPYAKNRFWIINSHPKRLRCFYCESDVEELLVGQRKSRTYFSVRERDFEWSERKQRDLVIFSSADAADSAGYAHCQRRDGFTAAG